MYALVDKNTNQIVAQKGQAALTFSSLARVDLPNGDVAFACQAGQEWPGHKLYEVTVNTSGSGTVVSDASPVFTGSAITLARTLSNPPAPTVLTYSAFKTKFIVSSSQAAWDNATDWVFEADILTGKPKRRAAVQALMGAVANNQFDLEAPSLAAWLDALITATIVTAQQKTAILTP